MQSYRQSHYGKDRLGVTLDEEWFTTIGAAGSSLRAGIWYEDSRRDLGRDWHRILDPSLSFNWDERAYWHQYEWDFPQQVFKWYAEETIFAGPFALSGGVKQFLVGVSREDLFDVDPDLAVDSDSSLLFSGGVTYETPVEGLDLFAGYSENFKALERHCSSRCPAGAWTCSSPRPQRTSTSACSTRGSGWRWAPRGTASTSRTGSSTSARKHPPARTT